MRAKSFFGCFQHIQQNIGFIRRAVCEDPLCFDVGHLRHTGELPAQERISRHLQCICDTDKGFETHDFGFEIKCIESDCLLLDEVYTFRRQSGHPDKIAFLPFRFH